MGTASSMELVRYSAEHRTKRDIIVNLNNGEEDFLWGAKAYTLNRIPTNSRSFVNHPWSREVIAFVNLEGAGAGSSLDNCTSNRQWPSIIVPHIKCSSCPRLRWHTLP